MINRNKIELLAPAGDYEKGIFALNFGADAIYIGSKSYSLRARASNFSIDEIRKIVKYAHNLNKKVYVALNIFCHNAHLKFFSDYFREINNCGIDGVICADPFIIDSIYKINPKMDIHLSTQQSITNSKACLFWKRNNIKRIVLAREVNYENLKNISNKLYNKIEIEYFIHGAVCISYSGRCTMSNNFSFRDANIGGCAQSCRWNYEIINCPEIKEKFTMSAKDMNLSVYIDKIMGLNISSLKIEGRMKSIHYIVTIVSAYRKLINEYIETNNINSSYLKEINKSENRQTDTGCFMNKKSYKKMIYEEDNHEVRQIFLFIVNRKIKEDYYEVTLKNKISVGCSGESISYIGKNQTVKIIEIIYNNKKVQVANKPMYKYIFKILSKEELFSNDIIRKLD
ncbi:MAG: U32 family peptidase C-terminal domain-containing protein [Mycoplasmoidaceae bacterium]